MNSAVISKSTTNFISRIPAFGFLIALLVLVYLTSASAQTNAPITARDFFNAGTRLLGEKKYTEAEKMFQTALTIQDEHIQPPSLYNVGHERKSFDASVPVKSTKYFTSGSFFFPTI